MTTTNLKVWIWPKLKPTKLYYDIRVVSYGEFGDMYEYSF